MAQKKKKVLSDELQKSVGTEPTGVLQKVEEKKIIKAVSAAINSHPKFAKFRK